MNTFLQRRKDLSDRKSELLSAVRELLKDRRAELAIKAEKANAMNPLSVLTRGYSIIEKDGKPLCSVLNLSTDDTVSIKFSDGAANAKIERITERKA